MSPVAIVDSKLRARSARRATTEYPAIPLRRIVTTELRKMFDTRAGFWLMASIVITALLATGGVVMFAADGQLAYATFTKAIGFPIAAILPVIAILSVTSEWSQRSGLTTFTLVPRRHAVIAAKGIACIGLGVVSTLVAFGIGALGNLIGAAIAGRPLVWDVGVAQALLFIGGNVLGLLSGFMLGVLIRSSAGAVVGYFVYTFLLPALFALLASSQTVFGRLRGWVDVGYAQMPLLQLSGAPSPHQWAQIGVTAAAWLIGPLLIGLAVVMKSEIK